MQKPDDSSSATFFGYASVIASHVIVIAVKWKLSQKWLQRLGINLRALKIGMNEAKPGGLALFFPNSDGNLILSQVLALSSR